LEKELRRVRNQGYEEDNEEIMDNLKCVAVPIGDCYGKVCSAISISGPSVRMTDETMKLLRKHLLQTTKEISTSLGYCPIVRSKISGD
jgi:DNA-binding IclR family transcriptional regulator